MKEKPAGKIFLSAVAYGTGWLPYFLPLMAILYIYGGVSAALLACILLGTLSLVRQVFYQRIVIRRMASAFVLLLFLAGAAFFAMIVRLDFLIHPGPLVLAAGVAILAVLFRGKKIFRNALYVAAALLVLQMAWSLHPLAVVAVLAGGFLLLAGKKFAEERPLPAYLLPLAFLTTVAMLQAFHFYIATPKGEGTSIASQVGVRAVFSFDDKENSLYPVIGPHLRFCVPAPDGEKLIMGTRAVREQGSKIISVPRVGEDSTEAQWIQIEGTAGDNVAFDPGAGKLYLGDQKAGKIYRLALASLNVEKTFATPSVRPGLFYVWPDEGRFFYLGDTSQDVFAANLGDLSITHSVQPGGRNADLLWAIPSGPLLHAAQNGVVTALDGLTMETLWRTSTGGSFLLQLAADITGGRVFASEMLTGKIFVMDLLSGNLLETFQLSPGVRSIVYLEDQNRLAVANYLSGDILLVDPGTGASEKLAYGGRRVRSLAHHNGFLYFTSWGGAFELSLSD